MGGIDLYSVQQEIYQYVKTAIPQFLVETGGIPTAESLPFENGRLEPYIILRFSDMMPQQGGGSFGGARFDEQYSYVDALCLAETDTLARELAALVNAKMMGHSVANSSELGKTWGGGQFAIPSESNRSPVAYIVTASYRYTTNVEDVGSSAY
jgi:hypothetical protein